MNDTPFDTERRYREMLLRRSGAERLKMGCSMFATARALVVASVLAGEPTASTTVVRRALFVRFYGADFAAAKCAEIVARLGGTEQPRPDPRPVTASTANTAVGALDPLRRDR